MDKLKELEKLGDLKYTDLFWPYFKQLKLEQAVDRIVSEHYQAYWD